MASIKLTGDTSGEITISAPAVAGTNTLTLPASTSTIATSADLPTNTPNWFAKKYGSQSVSHNTDTLLIPDSEVFDSDSGYDTSTGRYTVPTGKGGRYYITMGASANNLNDGSFLRLAPKVNGAYLDDGAAIVGSYEGFTSIDGFTNNGDPRVTLDFIVDLSAGDYVEMFTKQNQGSSCNIRFHKFGGFRLIT